MDFEIRRAGRHDQEALVTLWRSFMREQAEQAPAFEPADDAERRWRNDLPGWLRDETRRFFVAERGGELVGFVSAQRWSPPPLYVFAEEVYLNELYVHTDVRNEEVGRCLVGAVESWADDLGAARIRLGVAANNEAARAFWEGRGARPISITYALTCKGSAKKKGRQNKGRRIGF